MHIGYDHKQISAARKLFLEKGEIDPLVRPEIAESWVKSRNMGIQPESKLLPDRLPAAETAALVTDYSRFLKNTSLDWYNQKHALLDSSSTAIFYANEDLIIYIRAGNRQLTDKLKTINFGFGTQLLECKTGTNAGSLAVEHNQASWVIGAEHYAEALQNYVTAAVPIVGDFGRVAYILLVTELNNFSSELFDLFKFIMTTERTFYKAVNRFDKWIKDEFLRMSMEEDHAMYVFVNKDAVIISANNMFFSLFDTNYYDCIGKPLHEVVPEVKQVISCMVTGHTVDTQEVSFPNLAGPEKSFFMNCTPVKKDDNYIGLVIKLSTKQSVQHIVHKVANYNAHYTFDDLLGTDTQFLNCKILAQKAALNHSTVLIEGESGTGKELFAHAIHNFKDGRDKPFITVNCAAIPRELIGSILFGYVEGAFTGARKGGAQGKFELANGGTLFLDEIAEMPLDMQSTLLRVLEDKTVTRLGDNRPRVVNVRLITATNRNLLDLVNARKFRQDLYYRLNVNKLEMIPLRERPLDIPILANRFLRNFSLSFKKPVIGFSEKAMFSLQSYSWPGNIRELRNIVERCVSLSSSEFITYNDIPPEIIMEVSRPEERAKQTELNSNLPEIRENYNIKEKEIIKELMKKYNGNKSAVASELRIARSTLYRKLKHMGNSNEKQQS